MPPLGSGIWKSLLSIKIEFDNCIRFQVNNRQKVRFWDDLWCGNSSLKYQFYSIYLVERSHHANFFLQLGGSIQWVFNLRRDLVDGEINDLAILIDMLMKVFPSVNIEDKRLWAPDSKSHFSVRSFYNVLIGKQAIVPCWKVYWHTLIPLGVGVFYWVVRLQKILTVDNLKKHGHIF